MIDFTDVKAVTIPEGIVKKIIRKSDSVVLWEKAPTFVYTNLVPTALAKDGTVLDGVGYRRGATWNGSNLLDKSAFTAVGLMPIDGTVSHDIYVYGLDFSGTTYNRFGLFTDTFSNLAQTASLKAGFSDTYIESVTKLADNYFKITTKTYSNKVKYFAISAVTVSDIVPIVTLDEEITE